MMLMRKGVVTHGSHLFIMGCKKGRVATTAEPPPATPQPPHRRRRRLYFISHSSLDIITHIIITVSYYYVCTYRLRAPTVHVHVYKDNRYTAFCNKLGIERL